MPVKSGKRCGFVFDSCLKDSAFAAVRRDAKFYTRYVKRVPFLSNKTNAVPFFVSTPPPPWALNLLPCSLKIF